MNIGDTFRIVKAGGRLSTTTIQLYGNGSYSTSSKPTLLAVGRLITFTGYRYSGGSDGIDEAEFRSGDTVGTFTPSCWGSPSRDYFVSTDDEDQTVLSVALDACNEDLVVGAAARFGVQAVKAAEALGHGFPVYEYRGTRAALTGFLNDQYADGSGDDIAARYLDVDPGEGDGALIKVVDGVGYHPDDDNYPEA